MALPVTLSPLPVVGRLSYDKVRFEELFKSKMTGRVEWDRARRVVKYIKYILEVDGYVISTNSLPNDPTWSQLRYTLQQPGLPLTYSDRGFANFNINTTQNGLVDVCNGPHPELLDFTPMGARLAAHITWRCEICIPEIATMGGGGFQSPFSQGILAFNYTTSLDFQNDGYANYTIEGELEIARVNGRPDNLEGYRAYTEPRLPPGFKPTQRIFKTDDAKRQIKFVYSFAELPPMGIPARCTAAGGNYVVSCNEGPALVRWTANLQATYTVVPTGPRREAYMRFLGLLRDRFNHVRNSVTPTVANGGVNGGNAQLAFGIGTGLFTLNPATAGFAVGQWITQPATPVTPPIRERAQPIIRTFSFSEGLYEDSKSSSFACSWTFITSFESIFRASGAWRPMNDCSGQSGQNGQDVWVADMADIVGYTSWYNYGFRHDAEVIIQADGNSRRPITLAEKRLQTGSTATTNNRVSAGAGLVRDGVDPDSGASPDAEVRLAGLPSPEASWLNYQVDFITELDPGIALHKTLPQCDDPVDTLGSVDLFGSNPESDSTHGINTVSRSTGADILQRMATSTYRVAVRGFGVRAGYKVPVPDLKTFGGITVSPSKQRVIGPRIVANYSGVPIYMTAWLLWYDVPLPPRQNQKAPPNLVQHIGDVVNPPITISVPISVPEKNDNASFGGRIPPNGN